LFKYDRYLSPKEPEDILQPRSGFLWSSVFWDNVFAIDRHYVCDEDGRWVTAPGALCGLGIEIVSEFSFSLLNFARAASSAALARAVSDDPDGLSMIFRSLSLRAGCNQSRGPLLRRGIFVSFPQWSATLQIVYRR
jgi:hypothetical protein